LRLLLEVAFPLPMPRDTPLLTLPQVLIYESPLSLTLGDSAQRPSTSKKTLSRLFKREPGMNNQLWLHSQRRPASHNALVAGN
ncbi:AraC family transcriptional regulator, partial [Pseudomonas aeruginosa]